MTDRAEEIIENLPQLIAKVVRDCKLGGDPSIYRRGDKWRYHFQRAGNRWEDGDTPLEAAESVTSWPSSNSHADRLVDLIDGHMPLDDDERATIRKYAVEAFEKLLSEVLDQRLYSEWQEANSICTTRRFDQGGQR